MRRFLSLGSKNFPAEMGLDAITSEHQYRPSMAPPPCALSSAAPVTPQPPSPCQALPRGDPSLVLCTPTTPRSSLSASGNAEPDHCNLHYSN